MSIEHLLLTLSDGEFHSGDALGRDLQVSRTAIWKQIKKVEQLGVKLTSVRGKGYQIEGGLDLLCKDQLLAELNAKTVRLMPCLEVLDVVDSTNAVAMKHALEGQGVYVCTAEQQTAGKGRRQRAWVSPYAANLYFSIVWEFVGGASTLEGLSLAVGVTVAEVLAKAGIPGIGLKWPNDILFEQQKMAGILIEITGDIEGPCRVVIGIGVNVNMPKSAAEQIDQPWIDINTILEQPVTRNRLLAMLLNGLMPMLTTFEQGGFATYRKRWQALDVYFGEAVQLDIGGRRVVGEARGVDDTGALIVETAKGKKSFSGGEVSLRRRR